MSDTIPKRPSDVFSTETELSPALDRLIKLEATDLAGRPLTRAEIDKLADELLALVSEGSGA